MTRSQFQRLLVAVLLVAGCRPVSPTPTPAQPTTAPASSAPAPSSTAAGTPTVTAQPSTDAVWQRVESETLAGTSRLYRSLSADDAVFALSQTCAESCMHQVLVTSDGIEWRPMANQIPDADSVEDLAYADGRYVSVGTAAGGAIWTSLGSLWSKNDQTGIFDAGADGGPLPPDPGDALVVINAVVHGPSGWLAGGTVACLNCLLEPGDLASRYAAWTSSDGRTWAREPWQSGPGNIVRAASNGQSFVAVGYDGVWQTSDGRAWRQVISVDPFSVTMIDVAALGGEYLALGRDEDHGVLVWQSADGDHWTQTRTSLDPAGAVPVHLQGLVGNWLVVGSARDGRNPAQSIWSSADGRTWASQLVTAQDDARVEDVGAIGERLVASGWLGDGGSITMGTAWLGGLP